MTAKEHCAFKNFRAEPKENFFWTKNDVTNPLSRDDFLGATSHGDALSLPVNFLLHNAAFRYTKDIELCKTL